MNKTEYGQNISKPGTSGAIGKAHWIAHQGVKLFVQEKFNADPEGKPVVVLAHGSATAGIESFDLQVPGKSSYSLMSYLAGIGFDVFAPDVRGFGRSTKPEGPMNTRQAGDDLNAAVDYILQLRKIRKVHLLGWSWGTQYGGLFTMANPHKVARYISYAQMHADSPDIVRRRANVNIFRKTAYVNIPMEGWKQRFHSLTPESANDSQVIDTYAEAAARIETKTPTGPQLDMVRLLPMVHARRIPVPTMIIHGEYDDVADTAGLSPFFDELPNPDKRYVIVPMAGHMMHLQKGHKRFQQAVADFFKSGS